MAQKRTSRKKKQRVLKKKEEKTVGGLPFGRTQEEDDAIREARKPIGSLQDMGNTITEGMSQNIQNLNTVPNAIGNSKFVQEGKKWYNTKQEEYKKASEDLVERARNPIRSSQAEMKDLAAYNAKNHPPETTNVLNTVKNAFDTPLFKKKEEKKKKGKIGNFEKKFAKVGEQFDKIAFDLDFDSLKSSDKAAIIKQTLIESSTNKSKIVNDGVQEKINTETGFKNANFADVIWAEAIRPVDNMLASLNKAASGKKDKDQGTKTTTVIETEVFPAQKEKIHTPLLKFLYDMILVPENDEEFKKIVWSFIAKINEKALIDKNVPSGFKEIQEITYTTNSAMAGYTDTKDGEEIGPANGGSTRKGRRKKQRGGTLQLNGLTVQFDVIEKETLFYSVLSNGAEISTTNNFLKDLQEMDKTKTYPFSLLFFDLETIEEDWLQKPESVDILLGLLKEKEKGILVADPELEFKGTQEKLVLRATFRLENGVYGIFVHNSVDDLDTVLNLLDGMELVEVDEKEEVEVEKKVKEEVEKKEVKEVPIGATSIGEENNKKEEEKQEKQPEKSNWELEKEEAMKEGEEFEQKVKEAKEKRLKEEEVKSTEEEERNKPKRISDAILKTAIRLVADSLKKKATPKETAQKILNNVSKTGVNLVADGLKGTSELVNVKSEEEPELQGTSEFVAFTEDQVTALTKLDPEIVPVIENNKQEINITNNYTRNVTKIINNYLSDDELKKKLSDLKTDVAGLKALIEAFVNSQVIHDIGTDNIQDATEIKTTDSETQTSPPDNTVQQEQKQELETFKQELQEKNTGLENKIQDLQQKLLESNIQNKLTVEEKEALAKEKDTYFSQLQELQKTSQEIPNEQLTKENLEALGERPLLLKEGVPPLSIKTKTTESNENSKPIVPFKISETGLRVGGLEKGSHLFKNDAVHIGWDYIKGIRDKYENYKDKEPKMYKKIISPAIISERVTMCKNLLNILDNLTDIKKIEERKKHKKNVNVSEIYLEHVSIIAYILNYQNFNKLPITTVTSKNNEMQKYKPFTEDNLLYYLYKKKEISGNSNITIKELKDTTNILDFFEKVRSYLYQELKKIDDSLSTNNNYFEPKKGKNTKSNTRKEYDELLQEIHKIIQQKQQNLKDLEDKNDENVKLINMIPHKDRNKGGEKIDIHIDTPNLEDYINKPFLIKSGQTDPTVTETPKEVLKHNYDTAIIPTPTNLNILDKIDTTIKLNREGIVDYEPINFLDLIDIAEPTTVEIPIPKNKKNKTKKNTEKPSSGRQSRRSLNSDSSKAESEDQENTETYIVKPIKTDVSENVTSIINVLNKISKEDIQGLLKNPSNSEINSNSSSRRSSNTGSFVTSNDRPVSGNSSNSAETIQSARNISPGISPGISPNSSNFGTPTGTPLTSARNNN